MTHKQLACVIYCQGVKRKNLFMERLLLENKLQGDKSKVSYMAEDKNDNNPKNYLYRYYKFKQGNYVAIKVNNNGIQSY